MKTLYALLLHSVGLSVPEAAALHKVSRETVTAWLSGTESAPSETLRFLYANIDLQAHAADWVLRTIRKDPPENLRICITDDINEAGTLGWPTPSVMNGAVRRFLEYADDDLRQRTTLVFNPATTEDRRGTYFFSVRLREDGSLSDPDNPPEEG